MALAVGQAIRLARVARGILSARQAARGGGAPGSRQGMASSIARALASDAARDEPGANMQALRGLALRVVDGATAGAAMNRNPRQRNFPAGLPRDDSLDGRPERYVYHVAVTGNVDGARRSGVVEIYSDTLLSKREIEADLAARVDWDRYARGRRGATMRQAVASAAPVVRIVSVGTR